MASKARNHLLARLSRDGFSLLQPHLESVDLPVLPPLETDNGKTAAAFFIDRGFTSRVANGLDGREIEIGREGMTGLSALVGADRPMAHHLYAVGGRRPADCFSQTTLGRCPE